MQITPKARLISVIVALVFMFGALAGTGAYLIVNHINKTNATTETTLSVSQNLYNTNGTLNGVAVAEFLEKLDFVTSGGTYTSPQIADNAGITATNSFIFPMGYVVSNSGSMTTRPIYWQAVYAQNGYLTIWMIKNYTTSDYNDKGYDVTPGSPFTTDYTDGPYDSHSNYSKSVLRDVTNNIYDLIAAKLNNFSTIVRSPSEANATWQATQTEDVHSFLSSYYEHHNGLQSYRGSYTDWSKNLWDSSNPPYNDKFWIPSSVEVFNKSSTNEVQVNNGLWGLTVTDRSFSTIRLDTNTTTTNYDDSGAGDSRYCWLRSGYSSYNQTAMRVNSAGSAEPSSVSYSYGVRPACHISLSALANAATYIITVQSNNTAYGIVSGGGMIQINTSVTITATPNTGYHFVRWESNGATVSTDANYTFTATASGTYTAIFEPNSYTITANISPVGAGSVTGGGPYIYNIQASLTASANSGYEFLGWDTNGDGSVDNTANPYTFTVTDNATITAIFKQLITITICTNNAEYGQIFVNGSLTTSTTLTQDVNTQINDIMAIAKNNCAFLYWYDESTGSTYTNNPLNYTITQTTTLIAVFSSGLLDDVAVVSTYGGSAEILGDDFETAGEITLIARLKINGYKFVGWYVGNSDTPISTEMTVTLNYDDVQGQLITARFAPINNTNMNDDTDNTQTDDFVFF